MSCRMARAENGYRCSNRNKCRTSPKRRKNDNVHEAPERDIQRNKHLAEDPEHINQFPPPGPPNGPNDDWELQFCKWSGWTWVKKTDKEVSRQSKEYPPEPPLQNQQHQSTTPKKKKGGLFSCFKKKEPKQTSSAVRSGTSLAATSTPSRPPTPKPVERESDNPVRESSSEDSDECCCCRMEINPYCCPCQQMCCPCMLQNKAGYFLDNENESSERRRNSKTIETQTCCEMKEQACETCHPKKTFSGKRRKCRCRRTVCCPCMRNTCCPCIQNMCCPCRGNPPQVSDKPSKEYSNDKLVNYCLTHTLYKPSNTNLLNLKSSNFATLHKSLDILLKNNINIMSLFSDKKELQKEITPTSSFNSNHTITGLSSDKIKADQEHCKLLTAVCDAILSSHKFDHDKFSSAHPGYDSTSKSAPKRCEGKDSHNSVNMSGKSFLEKILSDLNFSRLKSSTEEINLQREIGIQVNAAPPKHETFNHKKCLARLVKNKSRILTAPRFPRKVEALRRNIDSLRFGSNDRNFKRCVHCHSKNNSDNKKTKTVNDGKLRFVDAFKTPDERTALNQLESFDYTSKSQNVKSTQETVKLETIETLLNSFEYLNSSSHEGREKNDSIHLLDATSPPFTDLDLLLSPKDQKNEKGSCSG